MYLTRIKIDHRHFCFEKDDVKSLCDTFHLSKQLTRFVYNKFKANGGRNIPGQLNELLLTLFLRVTLTVSEGSVPRTILLLTPET